MDTEQIGDRAVVIGASIAGLLAAHVLADRYGQVTVIDRDEVPETPTHRRGVPHGRHLHALAARGQQALEELLPGLSAALVADGAPAGDLLADARFYLSGHRLRQGHSGLLAPVRQPTTPRAPRPDPGANPPQPRVPRSLRCRRSGHVGRRSPRRRGARAPSHRRQRRGAAARRPRRRCQRSQLAHPRVARGARVPATAAGAGADRAGLRQPGRTGCRPGLSTATWRCSSRRRRSTREPGPCSGSRTIGGC